MGRKSDRQKGGRALERGDDGDDGDTVEEAGLTTGEASGAHADAKEKRRGDDYSRSDIIKAMWDGSGPPAGQNCHSRRRT